MYERYIDWLPLTWPQLGTWPVPWLGIEPVTFWFAGWHSIHWASPAMAGRFLRYLFSHPYEIFVYPIMQWHNLSVYLPPPLRHDSLKERNVLSNISVNLFVQHSNIIKIQPLVRYFSWYHPGLSLCHCSPCVLQEWSYLFSLVLPYATWYSKSDPSKI